MGSRQLFGLFLLAVGIVLLVMGVNATGSIADRVSETFTGRFTDTTTWYLVGGGASTLLGLFLIVAGRSRRV